MSVGGRDASQDDGDARGAGRISPRVPGRVKRMGPFSGGGVPPQRERHEGDTLPPPRETSPSDGDLVARMSSGDDAAYEELYRRHADAVRRYARTCCRDAHTADDLTAEVFARMLQAVRGGSGPRHAVRAYLLTCVRRVAAGWTQSARREQLVDDFAVFAERAARSAETAGHDALDEGADVSAMHEADRSMAMRAFRSLPERWQAVLWHTEVEDESPSEVATLFGLDANGTRVLASRAREGLKQAYLQAHVNAALMSDEECARYADQLGAYARRRLRTRAERGLRRHLDDCARCRLAALQIEEVAGTIPAVVPLAVLGWLGASGYAKTAALLAGGAASGAGAAAGAAGAGGMAAGTGATGAATGGGAAAGGAGAGAAATSGAGTAAGGMATGAAGGGAAGATGAGIATGTGATGAAASGGAAGSGVAGATSASLATAGGATGTGGAAGTGTAGTAGVGLTGGVGGAGGATGAGVTTSGGGVGVGGGGSAAAGIGGSGASAGAAGSLANAAAGPFANGGAGAGASGGAVKAGVAAGVVAVAAVAVVVLALVGDDGPGEQPEATPSVSAPVVLPEEATPSPAQPPLTPSPTSGRPSAAGQEPLSGPAEVLPVLAVEPTLPPTSAEASAAPAAQPPTLEPTPTPTPTPPPPTPDPAVFRFGELDFDVVGDGSRPEIRLARSSWVWQRDSGVTVHGDSSVTVELNGACTAFDALVGVDDLTPDLGSVSFAVHADGVPLWASGAVEAGDPAVPVHVDLAGRGTVRLDVEPRGRLGAVALADWAQSRFTCS
ncbi:sigma-70 family RNA polymerase sigma factor [Streptomyces sp. NPDC006172]|uniref:sigma-70 family RNA polymerase sigma factor n=1 Tax=Streptomyces sp. NPDC006172 TaxID=3154470 RepID=UPI0033DFCCC5